jgi:TRAP-type C4-dicarboxylate transport system permease small subunit
MKALSWLERIETGLKWLNMALVVGLTTLVFLAVLLRYALNYPLQWSDEVVGLLILALTYFGAALGSANKRHIYVEILESWLCRGHPGANRVVRVLTDLVTMAALGVMVGVGFHLALESQEQKTGILVLSYFWVYLVMPTGVALMVLMTLKRLLEDLQPAAVCPTPAADVE